ncbi:MAG: hypothetical protein CXX73_01680 [Methanobacteriota archaeon]|nr:MAG: hypothetical protein CXX73_01680 [Euryarchaeota archaeon]HIC75732.1 hypothetical protein [Candidatus Poseidoniales archaeon]HIN03688.1 hypothetical protein [Candidatus Poseidoniales archaeon]
MEEDSNQPYLGGTPADTPPVHQTVFVQDGPVIPVQKSVAAKVIGWFAIVLGCLGILSAPLGFIDFGAMDFDGNPVTYSMSYKVVTTLTALVSGGLAAVGGYKMTNYEKKGIWLIFGSFAVNWVGGIAEVYLSPDVMGLGQEGMSLMAGAAGFVGIFCYAICGLIVAIPLLMANGGME